jgi:Zn-finger nucleic acid-binding protein
MEKQSNTSAPVPNLADDNSGGESLSCPRCRGVEMMTANMQGLIIRRCPECRGLFLGAATFNFLIQRQAEMALAGEDQGRVNPRLTVERAAPEMTVEYLRCPVCFEQMVRRNYAKCSGVIFDECMRHGVWLDDAELQQILRFIATGGHRLVSQLRDEARRRVELSRLSQAPGHWMGTPVTMNLTTVWNLFE